MDQSFYDQSNLEEQQEIYQFNAAAFIMVHIILAIFFLLLFIGAIIRTYRIQTAKKQVSSNCTLYHYLLCFLSIFNSFYFSLFSIQAITFYQQIISQKSDISGIFVIGSNSNFFISDGVMLILFGLVMSQFIVYDQFSRINNEYLISRTINDQIMRMPQSIRILTLFYIFALFVIVAIYLAGYMQAEPLTIINLVMNLSCPLFYAFYKTRNGSQLRGKPYKSQKHEKKVRRLNLMLIYFVIGRIIQAFNNIILLLNPKYEFNVLEQSQYASTAQYLYIGAFFINYTIFWILPLSITLLNPFFKVMAKQHKQEKLLDLEQETFNQISTPNNKEMNINDSSSSANRDTRIDSLDPKILELKSEDIILESQLQDKPKNQNGFGIIFKSQINKTKYLSNKFVCRKIEQSKISAYLIEELNTNVAEQKKLSNPYIQTIKAIAITNEQIFFLTPYFEKGSLKNLIDKQKKMNLQQQLDYLKQIANGMNYLHSQTPPICHLSLHSNNVMIYKDQIKIVDFGFGVLKKYISITNGYSTKSEYSAPELLQERSSIPNGTMAGDVYAFGILIWELVHGIQAYQNIPIQELIRINAQEQKRPKIDQSVPDDIKLLIRTCWQQDPLKRPSFQKILEYLNNGEETILSSSNEAKNLMNIE